MFRGNSLHKKLPSTQLGSEPKKGSLTILSCKLNITKELFFDKNILQRRLMDMAVHHGGKVGKAGRTLASSSSSKSAKSKAGKTLANHKAKCH